MNKVKRIFRNLFAVCLSALLVLQLSPFSLYHDFGVGMAAYADQAAGDQGATGESSGEGNATGGSSTGEEADTGNAESGADDGVAVGGAASSTDGVASADDAATQDDATADEGTDVRAATYTYTTLTALQNAIGSSKVSIEKGKVTSVTIETSDDLIKLSNAEPSLYQSASIVKGSGTGESEFNLCRTSDGLSFLGLGGASAPFKGTFTMDGKAIALNKPLFNNIELSADTTLDITWKGTTSDPIVATTIAGGGHTLTANVTAAPAADSSSDVTLTSPLLGTVTGTASSMLALGATYKAKGDVKPSVNITSSTGSIGLLVNTVDAGASLIIESLALPSDYSGTPTVQTTKSDASAGGLIGTCNNGATVTLKSAIDLSKFAVKGMAASGGFIGKATGLTLTQANGAKFTCPATVGDAASQSSGGFIGDVSFAAEAAFTGSDQIDTGDGVTLAAAADKGAGAAFGTLTYADSSKAVSFTGGTFKSAYGNGGSTASYGGLVGMIVGAAGSRANKQAPSTLKVEGTSTELSIEGATKFTGGVAGWLGHTESAALELKSAQVSYTKVATSTNGIGGVVGCSDHYSVTDINGVTVGTAEGAGSVDKGAGIAAECWNSVIRLGGVTDFSNLSFAENDNVAQVALVRADEPTLVFARGTGSDNVPADSSNDDCWAYKRCPATKIDDLGGAQDVKWGYGEVIRLDGTKLSKNLITVNSTTHKLEGPSTTDWSWQVGYGSKWADGNRNLTIASTQDFACLALLVQFAELWNDVYGLNPDKRTQLLGSDVTINLASDVNLSGTGIGGLSFDASSAAIPFSGAFNGNGYTITLAIGEPYGMRGDKAIAAGDASNGNGKIYRHDRLGLFNAVGGSAKINDLVLDGAMNFDNGVAVDAGALAATLSGDATLSGVTCKTAIICDDTFGNDVNVGGISGSMTGAGTVSFGNGTKAQTVISTGSQIKSTMRIGGSIGYVGDVASTFNVTSLEVGGSITAADCASGKIAQVGGFIGCIAQGTAANTTNVSITGLSFDSFAMTVGTNGDAKNGAGGLLGYGWGNAIVTIGDAATNKSDSTYALTANHATVKADSVTELGGLVYVASGHWIVNNYAIDLSRAIFNAANATMLGVLVGRGSRVENSTTYGTETYTGLYLEDKAYWNTAYKVEGIGIVAPKVTSFDEWVGNGTKPGSKLIDGDWNTVVSLHTSSEKLDMSGKSGNDNSYKNRSDFGASHNTNGSTRYFYNLDRAYAEVESNSKTYGTNNAVQLSTAEELLLWCAYRYAPPNIRPMIVPAKMKTTKDGICDDVIIGGENTSAIDLSGYSYYPTQPSGNATVKNAIITFHYSDIKAEQSGNKLNSTATQHENMHCGLLRTVGNGNLTVNAVTLSGTIGPVVNDAKSKSDIGSAGGSVSGALVCRYVYGSSKKVRKIAIDGVTLKGLTVDGVADKPDQYAPLLINEMQTYVSLDVKNVTATGYSENKKAASSLFGKLGVGSSADQVTASFSMIGVPSSKADTIFTRASLLESFGYGDGKTGSAIYNFYKTDETAGKVTYGAEIDSNGEYHGKQLWYYDEDLNGFTSGLVTDGTVTANETTPQFGGGYLPYVYKRQSNGSGVQYHEIKVNQRVPKLTVGCGTYGDPYAITKASELNAVAEYINTSVAADGWEVTITAGQTALCQRRNGGSTDNEVTYVYRQANATEKKWEKKTGESQTDPNTTLDDATMHSYLQSAYYSIEPVDDEGSPSTTLTLDAASFQGLGNKGNPFRGVIVGNLRGEEQAIVKIDNTDSANTLAGLIPYSYGSVVSNLTIEYTGTTASVAYKGKDGDGVPVAFFGGVIGCVLGGDNIIDGVSASASDGFSVAGAAGTAGGAHLVPVGGYVGAITGGGVLFRNSSNVTGALGAWHEAGSTHYDNPYVGRVIDGYAFSELSDNQSLNNTDRNYKVNNLNTTDSQCIVTDDTYGRFREEAGWNSDNRAITTTVNDSQGLLVLSAIISSGAGGGSANSTIYGENHGTVAGSRAYLGGNTSSNATYQFGNQGYGKVRNATYTAVGKPSEASSDFAVATKDDRLSPGYQVAGKSALECTDGSQVNSPYLVAKYATWQTGNICATKASGMDLQFADGVTFDMTSYGTGYTGLSGRYYSNACSSGQGADRDRIVPLVATVDGNGATIKVGKGTEQGESSLYAIKEYADDDYKLAGVGALFGTVTYTSANVSGSIAANDGYTVQNLNFEGCDMKFMYTDVAGKEVSAPDGTEVGVGLLAGTTANNNSLTGYGKYSSVAMTNCTVEGPTDVGGLIGASGYGSRTTNKNDKTWIVNRSDTSATDNRYSPVKLYNCSYSGMTVSGGQNVGGFVGKLNGGSQGGVWTTGDADVAHNSTIESTGSRVGGVFGVTGDAVFVNVDPATKQPIAESGKATITGVTLSVPATAGKNGGVGGLIGKVENNLYVHNLTVTGGATQKAVFGNAESVSINDATRCPFMNVGGIVGNITGGSEFTFDTCEVSNVSLQAREVSGGISGRISGSPTVTCSNVVVSGATFASSHAGGINGSLDEKGNPTFNITNTVISDNTFKNPKNAWETIQPAAKSYSGGICSDGAGTLNMANVLIDGNDFKGRVGQGTIVGNAKSGLSVRAAGVDIKPSSNKAHDDLPPLMFDATSDQSTVKEVNKSSYIAFGDYNDTLAAPDAGKTLYSDETNADGTQKATEALSPYVTTSPVSSIAVQTGGSDATGSGTAIDRYLFGDGANVDTATTIKNEAGTNVAGRYTYNNIGGTDSNGNYQNTKNTATYSEASVGSFNDNNSSNASGGGEGAPKQAADDFNVLVLSGGDADTVKDYLNIVTNGGYSDALRVNGDGSHVKATVDVFQLDSDKGNFVKQTDVADKALEVKGEGSSLSVDANGLKYDNGKGRFNLLTVTFTEAGQSYKVQVPIIVKRMLEINFTATYSEGSNFKSADYASKYDKHVLISSGETMTGYLTWTYNQMYSTPTQYGWNTHLASGGTMRPLAKQIVFGGGEGALPGNTQLTLVDAAHNDKAYHYTVPTGGCASVALTSFVDASGNPYVEQWLSETMGVTATEASDGAWVKLSDDEKNGKTESELINAAGAKIGGDYYRVKKSTDAVGSSYNLTVRDEDPKSESFYLVVRTPSDSAKVNGFTATSVTASMPTHLNYTLRNGETIDNHENTASTYSVASNYTHQLVDNNGVATKELDKADAVDSLEKMNVSDTISFGAQEYTGADTLYYQLDSSLVDYEGGTAASAHGYPTGTSGTYSFYVKVKDTYYTWMKDAATNAWRWTSTGTTETAVAAGADGTPLKWASTGGDMSLVLADSDGTPIDLSAIRAIAKESGNSQFTVIMKSNLTMSSQACQAGIIASQDNGSDKYTKPNYRAYLSPHAETLATSSNSAYDAGNVGYYRQGTGSSTIELEASERKQLGINVDDLKSADGTIALTSAYDFDGISGADAKISKGDTVTYTLSLQQRQDDGSYRDVGGISNYITGVSSDQEVAVSANDNGYTFTDAKTSGIFATRDADKPAAFKLVFRVKVNTDVEGKGLTYANYRLVLTAQLSSGGEVIDTPVNVNNLAAYANSDYVTYTLSRINTGGIAHS